MTRISRRHYLQAGSVAIGGTLAGCSDSGSNSGGGNNNGGSLPDELTVGLLSPAPHPLAEGAENGTNFAVEQINEANNLDPDLIVKKGTTEVKPDTAASEARRLVEQEDADVIIGPLTSESTLSVQSQVTADSGVILFGPGAASPRMSQRVAESYGTYKNYFTCVLRSPDVFHTLSKNYQEVVRSKIGGGSVVAIAEDLSWTQGHADAVRSALDAEVREIRFPHDTEDFTPIWSEAVDTGANLAMMAFTVGDDAAMLQQWAESKIPLGVMGVVPSMTLANFPDTVGGDDAFTVAGGEAASRAPKTDKTITYYDSYNERFDKPPSTLAWYFYDAVKTWAEAVAATETLNLDELVEFLEAEAFTTTMGKLDMQNPDEQYPHAPKRGKEDGYWWTSTQWQEIDGELQRVMFAPELWADHDGEHEYVLPPWME